MLLDNNNNNNKLFYYPAALTYMPFEVGAADEILPTFEASEVSCSKSFLPDTFF